ncbi:hypothetical protein B5F07_02420 [Lachnoclostridium sp. An169]|uniref:restriction endonuclease PLD domain-containing protein n=1 Tax=Lachnoclostridium sp. An169 TaxID=1965569 RepID=UPI000B364DA2|nr:restriction endonuclease PLD domain-containing protein [Lachnoclostridium sp. An169]OUP86169.1 hypothetical protein B5F07_02420 [Lachnoclostridium sp. An169]HJA66507.1 NgoFVII family restriction endonuclease [Candidatus Mediterraneibacter cottocaccae]
MVKEFLTENLKEHVLDLASRSDEVIVISGYIGPGAVSDLALVCPHTTVVYGMYGKDGISDFMHKSVCELTRSMPHLRILYSQNAVHAKIYVFKKDRSVFCVLTGSANLSERGLSAPANAEILTVLAPDYYADASAYLRTVLTDCIECSSLPSAPVRTPAYRRVSAYSARITNPLTVLMPLFLTDTRRKKYVPEHSGLNWGNQAGHSRKSGAMESYIPISARHIDSYPMLFPPKQLVRLTSGGKSTRENDPIEIIWDDGHIMKAIFSGNGVIRNSRLYPKQLTSNDGGGAELGGYIRTRMGLDERQLITYADLQQYGRDTIQLTLIQEGVYAADFSVI